MLADVKLVPTISKDQTIEITEKVSHQYYIDQDSIWACY